MEVLPFDEELAWESRDPLPRCLDARISRANRASLALARHFKLHAITGDAHWTKLGTNAADAVSIASRRS